MVRYDTEFRRKFELCLEKFGMLEFTDSVDSVIACDGDKCESYEDIAEYVGVPKWCIPVLYMTSKLPTYFNRMLHEKYNNNMHELLIFLAREFKEVLIEVDKEESL